MDKIKNKWICQISIGENKIGGGELSNSGHTSVRAGHIRAKHKDVQLCDSTTQQQSLKQSILDKHPYKTESDR